MLKTVSSVANAIGALNYKGTWNASTNNPTLTSSVGTKGDYYVVSVAGSTNLDGEALWGVGDWVVFNGSIWQKVDGGDSGNFANIAVTSLTGYMYANGSGNVTASTTIPVANVAGAVPNTVNVLAGGLLSGGGALTGNVTISLSNVPVANVTNAVPDTRTVSASGLLSGGGALSSNVTISLTSVPVANVTGAVPNTVNVLTSGLLSGGGALTGNVTITLNNVPTANVTGLGTMATQNASAVAITGGNAVFTSANATNSTITNLSTGNATITGGTENNVTYTNVSILSGNVKANLTVTNATNANATYQTSSLPLVPAGYIQLQLANATVVKVPYYAA